MVSSPGVYLGGFPRVPEPHKFLSCSIGATIDHHSPAWDFQSMKNRQSCVGQHKYTACSINRLEPIMFENNR